jgi:hypothetical protein
MKKVVKDIILETFCAYACRVRSLPLTPGERKWKKVYITKNEKKNAVIYDCNYSRAKDIRKLIKQSGK